MKVYKYNIDWQIVRAKLKKIKSIQEKITFVDKFFTSYPTEANKERIINWIEGLRIALRSDSDKALLTAYKKRLEAKKTSGNEPERRAPKKGDFSRYSDEELLLLFKDLLVRAKKWLGQGYINEEFDSFMQALAGALKDYTKAQDSIEAYRVYRNRASHLPNTYKWVF